MNDKTDPGLTGQQLHRLQAEASAKMQEAVNRIGLRQRCLELAVQVCGNQPDKVVEVARKMYEFASFPAGEVSVKIEPPA